MTGNEAQGTMGRVKNGGEARFLFSGFLCAQIFIETEMSGYEAETNSRFYQRVGYKNKSKL